MEGKKSISINLITSIVTLIINLGISFFLTPYLTEKLGTEAYGFISLANNFVNYATILTIALNSMSGRFISIEIHKGKEKKASEYFSSIFWSNILIIALLIIPSIFLIAYLEKFLNVPVGILTDVKILFALIFLNFFVGMMSSTYQVATFATNKLHLQSIENLEGNLIRVAVLIIAFMFFVPHVFYIGMASLIASIYVYLTNIYYKNKLLPKLENKIKLISLSKIKEVISAGIWNTVTRLGQILADGIDLIICNLFIDSFAMGQLAIAKTVGSVMDSLISTVSSIFQPEFIISYAKEKKDELIAKLKISMKITAIFANIPLAFFVIFGKEFYDLWLPTQNSTILYILTLLTIQGDIVAGIINPMYSIYTVTNKIKADAIWRVIIGVLCASIVFLILKTTNIGIYAVAGVSTLIGTIFNFFFVPIYVSTKCLKVKWSTFYKTIFRYIFTTLMITLVFYIIHLVITISSWFSIFMMIALCGVIGIIINFIILLNKQEKSDIIVIIKEKFVRERGENIE